MSFGGSVNAMMTSLKNNARRKRSFEERFEHTKIKYEAPIKDMEISKQKLGRIKRQIKEKVRREQRQKAIKATLVTGIISSVLLGLVLYFNKEHNIKLPSANSDTLQKQEQKLADKQIQINDLIILASDAVAQKNFAKAKHYCSKGFILDGENTKLSILNTKAFIWDCLYNKHDCGFAKYHYNQMKQRYGEKVCHQLLGEVGSLYLEYVNQQADSLLVLGYHYLGREDLYMASNAFEKAQEWNSNRYDIQIAMLDNYVRIYLKVGSFVYSTESRLERLIRTYGETKELIKLRKQFEQEKKRRESLKE